MGGQSYLPRCPPLGKNIFQKYTSGCWCGADEDFTSANTNLAIGPDVKVPATTGAAVLAANDFATEANYCVTAGATGVGCLTARKLPGSSRSTPGCCRRSRRMASSRRSFAA